MNEFFKLKALNKKYLWLINIAKDLKKSHQTGRVFVCCFALKSNRILTINCNSYLSAHPESKFGKYVSIKSPEDKKYKASLHAEIHTIKSLGPFRDDYHKIELFVVRLSNEKGSPTADAHPCKNCCKVLKKFNFKRISFTTADPYKIGEIRLEQ